MVANMRVGNMDGFCVGEPWGNRAIYDKIGFTAETTQAIWKDHPEKTLGTTAEFVQKISEHDARDDRRGPRCVEVHRRHGQPQEGAEIIADKSYVNCPVDVIDQRLEGNYDNGIGRQWKDPDYMKFYNDGTVNFPYLSDGMWFLTQHKRWGLLKDDPDYLAVAQKVNQIEIYKQAARDGQRRRCRRMPLPHVEADRRHRVGRQEPEGLRRRASSSRRTCERMSRRPPVTRRSQRRSRTAGTPSTRRFSPRRTG